MWEVTMHSDQITLCTQILLLLSLSNMMPNELILSNPLSPPPLLSPDNSVCFFVFVLLVF